MSSSAPGAKITRSIMLRPCPLLDLLPYASGRRMLKESLLATAQLVALSVGNGQLRVLLSDAVPEVFDKLDAFSAAQF